MWRKAEDKAGKAVKPARVPSTRRPSIYIADTQDEAAILAAEHERYLAAERAREAARREAERLEAERLAAEERERERAREAAAAAQRGRGRGRGTSVASVRARTTGIRPPSTGIPTRLTRPTSATGSRPTSAARGRYGHVQSSGYGPPGRRA